MCLARGEEIVASTPVGRLKSVANERQKIYFELKKKINNFGQNIRVLTDIRNIRHRR